MWFTFLIQTYAPKASMHKTLQARAIENLMHCCTLSSTEHIENHISCIYPRVQLSTSREFDDFEPSAKEYGVCWASLWCLVAFSSPFGSFFLFFFLFCYLIIFSLWFYIGCLTNSNNELWNLPGDNTNQNIILQNFPTGRMCKSTTIDRNSLRQIKTNDLIPTGHCLVSCIKCVF